MVAVKRRLLEAGRMGKGSRYKRHHIKCHYEKPQARREEREEQATTRYSRTCNSDKESNPKLSKPKCCREREWARRPGGRSTSEQISDSCWSICHIWDRRRIAKGPVQGARRRSSAVELFCWTIVRYRYSGRWGLWTNRYPLGKQMDNEERSILPRNYYKPDHLYYALRFRSTDLRVHARKQRSEVHVSTRELHRRSAAMESVGDKVKQDRSLDESSYNSIL